MGTIYKSGIPYSGGGGGSEYTAGNGIKIENDVISGTKVDASKGATNIIEVESFNASKLGFEFGEDVVLSASSPMLFAESVTLQEKLTAGDNITIENNTISADDEILVAVYEQTSYADVKAAIDAHKAIVLDMPANNNQFCMTFATYTNGGNALMYAIYKMSDRATLMTVTLTPQNQWTTSHTDLQDKLVSGTNIKTINNTSLLGSGNIDIQGGGGYTAGNGIDITGNEISVDDTVVAMKGYVDSADANLQAQIDAMGEPFRVKNWSASGLNVQIPFCTEDIDNTSIPKMDFTLSDEEGAEYQVVGMIAYEVKGSDGKRINCWPVCQFTGNGQKTLTVRWACMGSSRKTATSLNAWVLLKHR